MPKNKKTTTAQTTDQNGVFFLKIMLFALIGSMWVKASYGSAVGVSLPIGLILVLPFVMHEHFQIDKKIEYAVIVLAMLVGYFAPFGFYIGF